MTLFCKISSLCLILITHFLCFHSPAYAIAKNNETDRLALLEFKAKITNDPFGVMSSWNSSNHMCQWYGVKCGPRHWRVTALDLSSLKLSGTISPHVGNLSFLKLLELRNNSFNQEIPPQIGLLRRLKILSLANNSLGDQIPTNLSGCSSLTNINLGHNKLVGEIPVVLGSLLKLKRIGLENNNLIGTIPPALGNVSSLMHIFAYRNNLRGNLPDSLGQLGNLITLSVYGNQISGTIPPSIFNLTSVKLIDVSENHLYGTLPLGLGISFLPNIQFFAINANQFTGIIPSTVSNASNLEYLELAANNFTGTVPSLERLHKLYALIISLNHLGSGKADDLRFLSTLSNATALQAIQIASNNFGGELPQHVGNFSKHLTLLVLAYNHIFGNIPSGIDVLVNLEVLVLDWNRFSGTIPTSIGELQNLKILRLGNNCFTGSIPSSLGNLTNLIKADLSFNNLEGTIPSSLGRWKNLLQLDLSGNNFSGPIPPQLMGLSSLSIFLNLARNHFSGSLPYGVGNLKNLGMLDMHENMLSGEIPTDLGSCESLEILNLGDNLFNGSIPSSLGSLRGIRELNLSQNNLSGKIPEFFKSFNSMQLLDLSDNVLEGMVPTEGVFKNASATLVGGNKNLCGGIPDFGLPACKFEQPKRRLTVTLKLIISAVSILIAAALVLICLFLFLSKKKGGDSTSRSSEKSLLKLSYQSLLKATNGFSSENLIGTGSFGHVYKGILDQEGLLIAVKVFNLIRHGASKSFVVECEALRNIRHRNLIKVLTACTGVDYHGNEFKALVYDFMANGNLDGWLHPTLQLHEVPKNLNVLQRLNIAIDVACALEYLHHHCETPIIHCDLKPSNVLLNEEMIGHVSDFGLVKFLSDGTLECSANQFSSIGVRGTIGYCPPEYGVGSDVSTSGDIYSFGILLLEMFTGKRPTNDLFKEGLSLHGFVKRVLPEEVAQVIDPNIHQIMQFNVDTTSNHSHYVRNRRNNELIECLISIFEVGISCSAESPQERMNIGDVIAQLSFVKKKLLKLFSEGEIRSSLLSPGS